MHKIKLAFEHKVNACIKIISRATYYLSKTSCKYKGMGTKINLCYKLSFLSVS